MLGSLPADEQMLPWQPSISAESQRGYRTKLYRVGVGTSVL